MIAVYDLDSEARMRTDFFSSYADVPTICDSSTTTTDGGDLDWLCATSTYPAYYYPLTIFQFPLKSYAADYFYPP